jgi:hypothetical protein
VNFTPIFSLDLPEVFSFLLSSFLGWLLSLSFRIFGFGCSFIMRVVGAITLRKITKNLVTGVTIPLVQVALLLVSKLLIAADGRNTRVFLLILLATAKFEAVRRFSVSSIQTAQRQTLTFFVGLASMTA